MGRGPVPKFLVLSGGVDRVEFFKRFPWARAVWSPGLTDDTIVVVRPCKEGMRVDDTDSTMCGVLQVDPTRFAHMSKALRRVSESAARQDMNVHAVVDELIDILTGEQNAS